MSAAVALRTAVRGVTSAQGPFAWRAYSIINVSQALWHHSPTHKITLWKMCSLLLSCDRSMLVNQHLHGIIQPFSEKKRKLLTCSGLWLQKRFSRRLRIQKVILLHLSNSVHIIPSSEKWTIAYHWKQFYSGTHTYRQDSLSYTQWYTFMHFSFFRCPNWKKQTIIINRTLMASFGVKTSSCGMTLNSSRSTFSSQSLMNPQV